MWNSSGLLSFARYIRNGMPALIPMDLDSQCVAVQR